ncbi:MAG: site-specific DNA-methyltransferase [Candidatus Methylumidiphilus alinenensis]|uniref:site-specific DNA-methyltransferase (adenine-specific) n=1 Tax=Candidatus Methylumidiphilus alinenensis TaxID=2202197 RepID=A0A2W4RD35_9GAMM|nr:MAG: site-specific DNA-methyltransferase [Candidatus Methylumidiphilus alinenensis]
MADNYDDYTKDQLLRLLRERDRKPKFGLVWERDEIEHDKAVNDDFVALDFIPELSCPSDLSAQNPSDQEQRNSSPPTFRNLIIEGDNFDALRFLRMTHAGKVKCIYIDPPYNTGNRDFIYNDRFIDKDDVYKHSKWLEFMYRRLVVAKELLAEDGVIFVSIDDNEVFNLGALMNRVLGEDNHVATCVWQKRYSRENRGAIGDAHEYLLIFAINPVLFKVRRNKISLTEKQISVYKNIDPVHGRWRDIPMSAQGFRLNQMYEIVAPNGKRHTPPEGRCWSTVEPQYLKLFDQGRIYFGKDGNGTPRIIRYLSEVEGVVPWTWWPHEEVGHTDEARKEIQDIFGTQTAFDTPKPVRLIERILRIATKPNDLVVDFFAGSGTTAHAVMKLNAEDGGNRRFILVSNTEVTDAEPGKNLCRDVCAERVRRVMRGYTNKKGEAIEGLSGDPSTTLRTGFAYLRTRRIPAEAVLSRIEHEQVWIALQLIHTETLQPYATGSEMQTAELPDGKLAYCTKVNEEILGQLLDLAGGNGIVVVYSWQPGWLRQYLPNESITVEQIPAFLINRFGGDYAA